MRKKNAGALFMDFHVSPDDRIGSVAAKTKARGKTPAAAKRKPAKGERVEPGFGGPVYDDEPPKRGRAAKAKKASGRREKQPFTFGRLLGGLVYWLFVLGIWGGIALAGIVIYFYMQMPPQSAWAVPERPANIRVVAADGQLISNRGKTARRGHLAARSARLRAGRLRRHRGQALLLAFRRRPAGASAPWPSNPCSAGRITRGASTLTQQLAKNLFLTPEQTLERKVQEALLAINLERTYTKDEILELYLNRVFFGNNATGIEAAAQTYFGKSARNLSLGEAAILAGTVQAPSRNNPKSNPEGAAARARIVLKEMADEGYISDKEAKAAAIDPDQTIRTKVAGAESYVADWVESLMTSYVGDIKEDVVV